LGCGRSPALRLRGEFWFCTGVQWQAPTVGADVYRVYAEGDAPYCSTWSQTWLAAPDHAWADDGEAWEEAISEAGFLACEDLLYDWIDEYEVPLTTW
jgi:hypothetical protein